VGDDRSSAGDPARTLALLWRHTGHRTRPGPQPGRSVDDVVTAAVAIADDDGLEAVTMRRVAQHLNVAPMTLYTHVPGKAELLDLMLDDLYRRMDVTDTAGMPWRDRVAAVAGDNRLLFRRHPWAATVSTVRPPLGPGLLAKYDRELRAFDGTGLDDVDRDSALTFVLNFVRITALAEAETVAARRGSAMDDQQWWDANQPLLAQLVDETAFPVASRVGTAAGQAHAAAYDPDDAYRFGLRRVLDGLAAVIERNDLDSDDSGGAPR